MTNRDTSPANELPTTRQLNRATAVAVVVAGVILITAVLPAEYGIDPTGTGRVLGLTEMGEMKREAADEHVEPAATPAQPTAAAPATAVEAGKPVEIRLTLQPGQGEEVKATMRAGEEFQYSWATDGAEVRFELHGEPQGAAADVYSTYEKGTSVGSTGTFRAPFEGTHGWYWKNRTEKPITITVTAQGTFEKFALVE